MNLSAWLQANIGQDIECDYSHWDVIRDFTQQSFQFGISTVFPSNPDVTAWCVVQSGPKSWASIGVYKGSNGWKLAIKKSDPYTRDWLLSVGLPMVRSYDGNVTLRQLHYRLVDAGMPNSFQHYKRVVSAMIWARWNGKAEFTEFVDRDRDTVGTSEYRETSVEAESESSIETIKYWMSNYRKNRWENQGYYVEVWIEKKALQGVFERPCSRNRVILCPCKGNPSLTYLHDGMRRLQEAAHEGKKCMILYFGDYDATGEDIPRSIEENIRRMGFNDFDLDRKALVKEQVIEMGLPIAPTKQTDSRAASWDGLGQVELDSVEPDTLAKMCEDAIQEYFDSDMHEELREQEKEERAEYRQIVRDFVVNFDEDDAEEQNND